MRIVGKHHMQFGGAIVGLVSFTRTGSRVLVHDSAEVFCANLHVCPAALYV